MRFSGATLSSNLAGSHRRSNRIIMAQFMMWCYPWKLTAGFNPCCYHAQWAIIYHLWICAEEKSISFMLFWGVSSVPFPFWFTSHFHLNLVFSIIALVPNTRELEWQLKWLNVDSSNVISLNFKRDRTRQPLEIVQRL